MTVALPSLTKSSAWKALESHAATNSARDLRDLFAQDPTRGERLKVEASGIYLDYSKNRITDETVKLLLQLAKESGLRSRIDAMFRGEPNLKHDSSTNALIKRYRSIQKECAQ